MISYEHIDCPLSEAPVGDKAGRVEIVLFHVLDNSVFPQREEVVFAQDEYSSGGVLGTGEGLDVEDVVANVTRPIYP